MREQTEQPVPTLAQITAELRASLGGDIEAREAEEAAGYDYTAPDTWAEFDDGADDDLPF